ncbi:hypothetical protein [Photobacterium angustum]|uniref:Uncharacterized protein n=1 Tax=Photobacterium angustum TaxID=661 RepID=A0A855SCC6_PHOAN|nr:hypothetical protein [Photobacterium angustum]KJF81972.1 hypothetical protein UB36_09765 [Photobacterium damselae subsp. damselae]KJG38082.1 hypothetical protein UA35_16015 [Photobacterium angustum]KJG45747.1 hypothetical protein UA31_09770 [Photobacterium angustum]KJG49657.1 hypothetical protein UA30_08130 [Photobacterium angustum]KJG51858.1 hypothetical protein UA34_16825 [Photobacterium angustum]
MEQFIDKGILALANVVEVDSTAWFQGHTGAALLAGDALLNDGTLNNVSKKSLQAMLVQFTDDNQHLMNPLADSPETTDYSEVVNAIALNAQQLCHSGHGIIYGALFLNAVANNNVVVTERMVSNIAKLIVNCMDDNWGRYYGLADYRLYQPSNLLTKGEIDIQQHCVIAVERSTQDIYHNTDEHFFAGDKLHGITHAHAIFLLDKLGYKELAQQAAQQSLIQLELHDRKPESGLKKVIPQPFDLSDPNIWGHDFNEHQIKLVHSYVELSAQSNQPLAKLDNIWGAVV